MTQAAIGSKNWRICIHINNILIDRIKGVILDSGPYWRLKHKDADE